MRFLGRILISLVLLSCVLSLRETEAQSDLDRQAYDLYQRVFSPFCPGRSLNDCPSSKAAELKAQMRAQLEEGVPPEVILEDVFRTFGEKYRAIPAYDGFGKLVWWVPIGFFVVGVVLVLGFARGRKRIDAAESNAPVAVEDPAIQSRIEQELASLDR
jgi:cytochrome c-type biogenesis protein CcmH/NrfF